MQPSQGGGGPPGHYDRMAPPSGRSSPPLRAAGPGGPFPSRDHPPPPPTSQSQDQDKVHTVGQANLVTHLTWVFNSLLSITEVELT